MTPTAPTSTTPAAPMEHAHPADLDACLDLINSLELDDGAPEEHLPDAPAAIAWFTTRGLAHDAALRRAAEHDPAAWLAAIHDTRAALREIWDAAVEHRRPATDAVERLNDVLAHRPRAELVTADAGPRVGHRHEAEDPTAEALARVAAPLVEALGAGETDRFRICANDGCRWVFEDTSRGGRRRWCDMSSCGNRAKVRRYRTRRRGPGDDDGAEALPA